MNKLVIFLGNKEKQWECKSLPFDFSSRNKQKKKKEIDKDANGNSINDKHKNNEDRK